MIKKLILTPDVRSLTVLKICVYTVMLGVLLSIIMYTSSPDIQTLKACRQMLFASAFGLDIAIGGYLYMDHAFRKQKNGF